MQTWTYPALITAHAPDEWVATFPDVPEAVTGAQTRAETIALASDALEEAILAYLAHGRPIPAPRPAGKGETPIDLDPVTAARAALAQAMAEQRMSNSALAQKLGKTEGAIRRLTDGATSVKMATVLDALHAVGRRAALVSG
jgi:antitoxin HicB